MIPHNHVMLINRELSLLQFNERVLAMAASSWAPLLERLRYLCIVSSNLDEFFEIRVASLKEQIAQATEEVKADGYSAKEAFSIIQEQAHALVHQQHRLLLDQVLPALDKEGIEVLPTANWSKAQWAWCYEQFLHEIKPLLTPIGLDPSRPFPRVYNKSLNLMVCLDGEDAFGRTSSMAWVQVPRALSSLLSLPAELLEKEKQGYVLLSEVIRTFVHELFPGMKVQGCYAWRVTRNSDLFIDEEEATNLRQALQGELSQRNFGAAVRIEVERDMPSEWVLFLQNAFALHTGDTYAIEGPVNMARLAELCELSQRADLLFTPYQAPVPVAFERAQHAEDLFALLAQEDQLLHHPYQSFQPVLSFLHAAASDPQVVAIKQTIYRTGEQSELMALLIQAAKAGKEVTVVVELRARFDEQTNMDWAVQLEAVGAHVSYGVPRYKTHAKMLLVLRREAEGLRRYVHLSTGNYHPGTARLYTDFALFTADEAIGHDVEQVFSQLTGLGEERCLQCLVQAPFNLHETIIAAIRYEIAQAQAGQKAHIMAKMNTLLEPRLIQTLYAASQAGVKVDLIVRGACALRAGVVGLSENIRVISLIGRFLEHARVYYFYQGGDEKMYLSSADWMPRNFFRRVEIAVPIQSKRIQSRLMKEAFTYALADNQLAWEAQPNGEYHRVPRENEAPVCNIHERLMHELGQS